VSARGDGRTRGGALLRYAAAWLLAGTLAAAGLVLLLGGPEDDARRAGGDRPRPGGLGPVAVIELRQAARAAGCGLRALRPDAREALPAVGPRPRRAAAPGRYGRPAARDALVGAVRRGITVVLHRPDLPRARLDELTALQRGVPTGTVVAPEPRIGVEVAVAAWRRTLTCPRFDARALTAVRLFQARFLGRGPDSVAG